MSASALPAWEALREAAVSPAHQRLLVSASSCNLAVGASDVLRTLRAGQTPVVPTGCDGACHAGVTVTLQRPGAPDICWDPVDVHTARRIVRGLDEPGAALPDATSTREHIGQRRHLLEYMGAFDPAHLGEALARNRYLGLATALSSSPDDVLAEIERSGLTGRGGAYFPVAKKWQSCRSHEPPRYLVVNAEEGEPGVFRDRHLLEGDPHLVAEGILIAAYAIGATCVYVYLNGHARLAGQRLATAFAELRAHGLLGDRTTLQRDWSCDIEMRWGGGGYVLGEESALLESIEGNRPMPRTRPPFPADSGLWGRPTVINNVESLANVALIMERGADWFHGFGTESWPGTKLVCVSGDIACPGVVEIEIGTTLRDLVERACGGVAGGRTLQAVLTGGPSGVFVPPALLDTPLVPRQADVLLGSGNITVLDDTRSLADIARSLARFNADESCGKCTPCREGTHRLVELLDRAAGGDRRDGDVDDVLALCEIMASASLCGHGQMAPNPIRSALRHFTLPDLLDVPIEVAHGD